MKLDIKKIYKPKGYCPPIFKGYLDLAPDDGNLLIHLQDIFADTEELVNELPPEKLSYAYAEGKWTIKEVVGHVLDTERIMAYRALRFARNDTKALPGFEQEDFVANARFNDRSLKSFAEEFVLIRQSNLLLFKSFNDHELTRKGLASDRLISVRAFLYIIAGHLNHHRNIITERYL